LQQAAGWLEQYRRFWEESFDRLDDYLQQLQSEQKSKSGPAPTTKNKEKRNGKHPKRKG
jgi:hypothetical protein